MERSFTGQQNDFSSGLIYMKARYYDPELGQFLSPDTLVPDPGNLFDYNRYMYVHGNPMNRIDPTGHICRSNQGGSWDCPQNPGSGGLTLSIDVQTFVTPQGPAPTIIGPGDGCLYGCTNGVILSYIKSGEAYVKSEVPVVPDIIPGLGLLDADTSVTLVSNTKGQQFLNEKVSVKLGVVGYEYSKTEGKGAPTIGIQLGDFLEGSAQMWAGEGEIGVGAHGATIGIAGSLPQYKTFATSGLYLNSVGVEQFGQDNARGYVLQSIQIIGGSNGLTGANLLYSRVTRDRAHYGFRGTEIKDPYYMAPE